MANDLFAKSLTRYEIKPEFAPLFFKVITDVYNNNEAAGAQNSSELMKEITKLNERQNKARELLLNGDLDGNEYRGIKKETEQEVMVLEAKLADMVNTGKKREPIESLLGGALTNLTQLKSIYEKADISGKRQLVGSMFPQKFTLEEPEHRIAQTLELHNYNYLINKQLGRKKRRASDRFTVLAHCGS